MHTKNSSSTHAIVNRNQCDIQAFVIFVNMRSSFTSLSKEQRINAIQRLTALWAFTESGLGGVMHALQIPFTGLLVGGMSVIIICLIAYISDKNYKQILKSALIVLIVKAMVSPHTPFPAYVAVTFQTLLGYSLFKLSGLNMITITLLSTIAMLESAIQKLLVLTLFLGESLWKAMDGVIALLTKQFGSIITNGSYWIVGIYIILYFAGGLFIAWLAYRTIKSFKGENSVFILNTEIKYETGTAVVKKINSKSKFKKLWFLICTMLCLSAFLFFVSDSYKQGWLAILKTITWTLSAILIWFMLIGPLFTKAIQKLLQKKESRYSDEVLKTLSFLPVLKQITALAWQQSKLYKGFKRWNFFFISLIHTTLVYSEVEITVKP